MTERNHSYDPAARRAGVRRTVWIAVIVVVALFALVFCQHI